MSNNLQNVANVIEELIKMSEAKGANAMFRVYALNKDFDGDIVKLELGDAVAAIQLRNEILYNDYTFSIYCKMREIEKAINKFDWIKIDPIVADISGIIWRQNEEAYEASLKLYESFRQKYAGSRLFAALRLKV